MSEADDILVFLSANQFDDRFALWSAIADRLRAKSMLEVGVWKGEFAASTLRHCNSIDRYYMIDPWRSLPVWNKPFNVADSQMADVYVEAMSSTEFAKDRRIVLRGTTIEMVGKIPDESLDLAYIDGDHTLRGIVLDLISVWSKVRAGGVVGGDDFVEDVWQHSDEFEPTLICPFAVHFAEANKVPIVILPRNQFLIVKLASPSTFRVINLTTGYGSFELLPQVTSRK